MSRIGRKPILVPPGVKVQITAGSVEVQGPKVKLSVQLPPGIHFEQNDGVLIAVRQSEEYRAMHGLARALVANAVQGITQGFKKELDIVGVGYRAEVKGKTLNCSLGYSHPIVFPIPDGIQITVEKQTHLTVTGADRWGKYLGMRTGELILITHLSRAGWLRWSDKLSATPLKPGKNPIALRVHLGKFPLPVVVITQGKEKHRGNRTGTEASAQRAPPAGSLAGADEGRRDT